MRTSDAWIKAAAMAVVLPLASAAAQTITSVEPASQTRSGRIIIRGTGFGAPTGVVAIGGHSAIISAWSDTRIHAYIPEAAAPGPSQVVIEGPGPGNAAPVTVLPRTAGPGRLLWKFQADDIYIRAQPAIGPDGTIYAVGANSHIYALTPDGALLWARTGVAAFRPPAVGADGIVYVGGLGGLITALDPADGSTIWSFPYPENAGTLFMGPNVGPDGNIYGVTEEEPSLGTTFGAFSLTPQGTLRWNTQGGYNFRHFPYAWEVVFSEAGGVGRLFFDTGMGFPLTGNHGLHALRMESGAEEWSIYGLGQVEVDSAGNVYTKGAVNNNNIGSFTADGAQRWLWPYETQPGSNLAVSRPDGASFLPANGFGTFFGLNPDGTLRFTKNIFPFQYVHVSVRPDGGMVVAGAGQLGAEDFIVGLDPATGDLLWSVGMGQLDGNFVSPSWVGDFRPDGSAFYFPSSGNNQAPEPSSYLFAVDTTDAGPGSACYANCDGSTQAPTLNVADFTCFLSRFAAGDSWANCDQSTSAPTLNVADFSCFLTSFAAACP